MLISVQIDVTQLSTQLQDPADRAENPCGRYSYSLDIDQPGCTDEDIKELALDRFHNQIAIGCLDDFEICATIIR